MRYDEVKDEPEEPKKGRGRPKKVEGVARSLDELEDIEDGPKERTGHAKQLSAEELTDDFLLQTLAMQNSVKKKLKAALHDCSDPSKLSKIWLDLLEIHEKVKGIACGR